MIMDEARSESGVPPRVLIADDQEQNRVVLQDHVELMGYESLVAVDGVEALRTLRAEKPDLLLLDLLMPHKDGIEVLRELRSEEEFSRLPVIVISAVDEVKRVADCIEAGADDYLGKPFNPTILRARIHSCLARKRLADVERRHKQLLEDYNAELEQRVKQQVEEVVSSHMALIFAMSKLTESRDRDTGTHLERVREYCIELSRELGGHYAYRDEVDEEFIRTMYMACPLHDIGKVAIPDNILRKPGRLTAAEYEVMKRHTILGAATLRAVDREHPGNRFVQMGIEIAEYHHECWDGSGYPHGLSEKEIPLPARIVGLCDVYEALTSRRCYKDSFSHEESVEIIRAGRGSHFDPDVVDAFMQIEPAFQSIRERIQDPDEG